MKKIKILFFILVGSVLIISCDEAELTTYDEATGQTGIGFTVSTSNVVVKEEGASTTLLVQSTKRTSADRTFNVAVDASSTANSADYSIGTLTIPANSYNGTIDVTFGNYDNLEDLVTKKLILNIELTDASLAIVGSGSATISYVKYLICNDVHLSLVEDVYGSERTWDIKDSNGTIVQSGGPYTDVSGGWSLDLDFYLDDGCYTFTIYDSFGDGQYDGTITGSYSLTCSILDLASGGGRFGPSESAEFCINP